jgi:hypothetical protein
MARPRKPTAVLDARGAFKKNPQRRRAGEPIVREPIGASPPDFDQLQREAYQQIVSQAPIGVLTEADNLAVEMASTLLAQFRKDRDGFPVMAYGKLIQLLGTFGMTPSDRSKLNIQAPKVENPFARLG